MKKKFEVLVLYYSQTGKTKAVLDCFLEPLKENKKINLTIEEIKPKKPYPFPWPMIYSFTLVPECAYEVPVPLKPMQFDENKKYDLIILGNQVWFLSPSLPITSLLQSPEAKVFNDTPVVSVVFCRKMWRQAHACLEKRIEQLNSKVIDKVLVFAKGSQMKTLRNTKTNLYGKSGKDAEWAPSEDAIKVTKLQGEQLSNSIEQLVNDPFASVIKEESLGIRDRRYLHPEQKTKKSFLSWGKFMIKHTKQDGILRKILTVIYMISFFFKIFVLMPLLPVIAFFKRRISKNFSKFEFIEKPEL